MKQQRQTYVKPAVIFEKDLEALAADCNPAPQGDQYTGGTPNYCKGAGVCTVAYS